MIAKKFKVPRSELLRLKEFTLHKTEEFSVRHKKTDLTYNRYLVVVGRKISASAVVRNKVKRMFYRAILSSNLDFVGYDVVIYPNPGVLRVSVEDIRRLLEAVFVKLLGAKAGQLK